MEKEIDTDAALGGMPSDGMILTVNRRLSLELKARYDRIQVEHDHSAWESVAAISWSDWVVSQFQILVDYGLSDQILLTPHQSRMVWEQSVRRSDATNSILRPASAARMASEAWALIHSWQIGTEQLTEAATSESELFVTWASEFRHRCKREGWLDAAVLPNLIAQHLKDGALTPPSEMILAGFDEITPQQQSILDLLQERGCRINFLTPSEPSGTAQRVQAADLAQELESAATWALRRLQLNSEARIGVVVPQLAEVRSQVETTFQRCFYPESMLPGSGNPRPAYSISLGIPLDQCPLVVDAFLILQLATGELPCGDLSQLLRSPFLSGGWRERQGRARLDLFLRSRVGERTLSLDTLIRKGREFSGEDSGCSEILQALDSLRLRLDHLPHKQSPQGWLDQFNALLNTLGWPCYERLNSSEYQQAESFKQVMTAFQMLGEVQQRMGLPDAVGRLHALTSETLFQPQGEVAPVQVVGILEAAGLRFDHLWVLGLSDDRWPAAATPNPLLPISLQRELNLPHASPQRELEYAALITKRVLASAAEVVVSHAASDGGSELRVSPLVAEIPLASLEQLELAHTADVRRLGFGAAELEQTVDDAAPPLHPGSHLRGGSGLLADQSACPFRAFAKHRLGARVVEDPASGVDARIKGIMVHRVLQKLWERLGTQEQLLRLAEPELRQLVDDEVSRELNRLRPSRPETLAPRFVQMEQERVTGLIVEWLGVEREREPFTVVALEQKQTVEIGGLQLDIVADRVDRLEDGSNLIIDYKTGKHLTHKGWFEERIEEPQLPLYATTNAADVSGVFLAGVSRANMKFVGVSEVGGLVPGIKAFADSREAADHADWDGLRRDWQERLQLLATEILQGQAGVRPKNRAKDCLYCPLPTLCRIDEQDAIDSGEGSQ